GVDTYAKMLQALSLVRPDLIGKFVFVLCGTVAEEDVQEMERLGLHVLANVSDDDLIDFYIAADVYMNFSRWEGYNVEICQALAFGLPVIASDIPAHRELPILTSDDPREVSVRLAELIEAALSNRLIELRKPVVWTWEEPLAQLAGAISELCENDTGFCRLN